MTGKMEKWRFQPDQIGKISEKWEAAGYGVSKRLLKK